MIKIAITGNIASGKSTVQNILEEKGYKVLDTDKVGHTLLESLDEIKETFRNYDIFDKSGKISREKLGQLIFRNNDLKTKLEEIIHPAIKKEIINFFAQNKSENLIFVGIPLLFETNMRNIFDKALLIYTEDVTRKNRLLMRNSYTPEYAEIRMNSQIPQDEKKLLCDYVIYNNGTLSDLNKSVDNFLKHFSKP